MKQDKLFFVGVKALICNSEDKVLLLFANVTKHRKNTQPYWDIPGGRMQDGESAEATLNREILEETGVESDNKVQFLTSVISNHQIPLDDGSLAGLVLMVYKATILDSSKITISEEHTAFEWVSRTEAAQRLSHKYPAEFTDSL